MVLILAIIVVFNLCGLNLGDNVLILVTNLITAVFTYYFTKGGEDGSITTEKRGDNNDNNS